ncbi:hypothetical protein MRX96_027707 [Rhipicephalus microplus]
MSGPKENSRVAGGAGVPGEQSTPAAAASFLQFGPRFARPSDPGPYQQPQPSIVQRPLLRPFRVSLAQDKEETRPPLPPHANVLRPLALSAVQSRDAFFAQEGLSPTTPLLDEPASIGGPPRSFRACGKLGAPALESAPS